jgi:hypothetical protein
MIDPMISLAFSMHSNKGVYALLLGSGVSRSAWIPTGWEVVLDLIKKLASQYKEGCDDPETWYKDKFGKAPDYSEMLEELAKTSTERSKLLREYFEPTEEEREEGKKLPTLAHKSIAELVSSGHIRVILTTNFDHLMEDALRAIGIEPTVISSIDAIDGAMPLIHTQCTVIKVNGDYLDSRIKNTPDELAQYDDRLNSLLDRVFDDFGLIVCGWSADYDIALRAAIERYPNRRFTTYWSAWSKLGEAAERLINLRKAEVIKNYDADSFFQELAEKVSALSEFDKPHPLSAKVAVTVLKKHLEENRLISLRDLMNKETEKVYRALSDDRFPLDLPEDKFIKLVKHYENLVEILMPLMATGCYWGEEKHEQFWIKCLERIANPPKPNPGSYQITALYNLINYPALLVFYAGGIAVIASGKYKNLEILMNKVMVKGNQKDEPISLSLYAVNVVALGYLKENSSTPISEHIYKILREPLQDLLPQDDDYQKCFDRFEYLLALNWIDIKEANYKWIPAGRFYILRGIIQEIELESKEFTSEWAPLKAGLFRGSYERFQKSQVTCNQVLSEY